MGWHDGAKSKPHGCQSEKGQVMSTLVPDEGDAVLMTKENVFIPDDERIKDETGHQKQQKKRAKALQKEAGAVDNVEDNDEVPETANALLSLKRDRGEAGWV